MQRKFGRALSTCALLVAVGCTGPAADPQQGSAAQGAGTAPPAKSTRRGPGALPLQVLRISSSRTGR